MSGNVKARFVGQAAGLEAEARPRGATHLGKLAASLLGDRGCCFTFHRAVAAPDWDGLPNRGFYLDLSFLERFLIHLRETGWAVVTMEDALRRSQTPGGGRFVNFSVDDCYRDTADAIVPLFRRLGVPVTLFVTTGIPDGTVRLRDAGLETVLRQRDAVRHAGRVYALGTSRARRAAFVAISRLWDAAEGDAGYLEFCASHGYDAASLDARHRITWDMLAAMRNDPLVEIGAHTVTHPNLSTLTAEAALWEMQASRLRLEQRLGQPVRHFAFPFGRAAQCGKREFALAQTAGYASASTTRKGLIRGACDPYRIPRNTLNGATRHLLLAEAHLSGLAGLLARVIGRV